MALTTQFSDHISRKKAFAEQAIALRDALVQHAAEWNQNDMFNLLNDSDIAGVFPSLTKSEVSNAQTALDAIVTALGDYSSGQSVNLIKLR